jgi:Protein of unknown function (DUF4058)
MNHTNPFPGMNPFMETRWPGVHLRLIALMLDELGGELPADLVADGEVRVDVGPSERSYRPGISVIEPGEEWKHGLPPRWSPEPNGGRFVADRPEIVNLNDHPLRWIEIRTEGGELVTVIELISRAKREEGCKAYTDKRDNLLAAGVNVVEVDLLRTGKDVVNLCHEYLHLARARGEGSIVCVTRPVLPNQREVYYAPLRQRLPVIRVPLRVTDRPPAAVESAVLPGGCRMGI